MFGFLKKKKNKQNELYAVADGKVIPIAEVNDPVFSQKMMGDGFAVVPTDGTIFSPVEGEIVSVFQTKHAVGFKTDAGIEVLLHMGVDTVELNGEPFTLKVSDGQKVSQGTQIASVDLTFIKEKGKGTEMIVVITNMDAIEKFELTQTGEMQANTVVGVVTAK